MTTSRGLLWVGLAGAVGGMLNAALCYVGWPQPIQYADFEWHIVPAGFIHGGLLATVPLAIGTVTRGLRASVRWGLALPVAWVTGYVSWIPLQLSLSSDPPLQAFVWPLAQSSGGEALWVPIAYFGVVALLLYLWMPRFDAPTAILRNVLTISVSGGLGSLWFWVLYKHWYFSAIHGAVWGSLVGGAHWQVRMRSRRTTE